MAPANLQVQLYMKAVKSLVSRPHSVAEIRTKLLVACRKAERKASKTGTTEADENTLDCNATIDKVMTQLNSQSLLDDKTFATWHVAQRNTHRPRSKLELSGELSRKGIKGDLRTESLSQQNDLASAARLASSKPSADDKKLLQYLARKGFSPSVVRTVMQARCAGPEALTRLIDLGHGQPAEEH
jgi:SOS response regulatory protein OraA/RecX